MSTATASKPSSGQKVTLLARRFASRYGLVLAILFLGTVIALSDPYFLTARNLTNLLVQVSYNGLLATGLTFVILAGGIDLAVGSVLAFAGMIFAHYSLSTMGVPAPVAVLLAVLAGVATGIVSGAAVAFAGIPSFVATLAMMTIARGFVKFYGQGGSIPGPSESLAEFVDTISYGRFFGIPVPVALFIGAMIVAWYVLGHTRYGRYVYAVGGNPKAALVSGIKVKWVLFSVFLICGAYAGLAGVVVTSLNGSAQVITGVGYELDAIAAVVIGGTSLAGGRGGIVGTFFGVILIGLISNGLNLLNHLEIMRVLGDPSATQDVIKGLVILVAVLLDKMSRSSKS